MALDIAALVNDKTLTWDREAPAPPGALKQLARYAPFDLPESYIEFLSLSNGGEGELGVNPGWFQIWPAEEVQKWNEGYKVQEYLPGFYGFAGSGGGDLLVFKLDGGRAAVYDVPCIGMAEEVAIRVADSFEDFLLLMGHSWEPD